MTLKDCTKDELIFVIGQLKRHVGDYYVQRALIDVEAERDQRKSEESKRLLAIMNRKTRGIEQLYSPYSGDPYCHIPDDVIEKGRAIAHEYDVVQRKWYKLMGFNPEK